jgi:EmrB/QacA subfamily drug resistance transporter
MVGVCLALAAVQTSVAALNVAIPDIGAEFGASQGALLWVINGYTLTLAALLLPLGALGDRLGRKPMLVAGLVVFGLAALASSQAGSVEVLIALRVLTGVGGAMVLPATLSVITASFPPESKGTAIGVWAGVAGSGGLLGLIGASFIVDAVTWPWVFALILVPGALALAVVIVVVPNSVEGLGQRFDWSGAVLSSVAIGGLVLGIQEGPERGWSDLLTVVGLGAGAAAVVTWVVLSPRVAAPLLDLRLFRVPGLAAGSLALLALSGVSFGVFLILIQYLLSVLGFSAIRSAASLTPVVVLTLIGAQVGPRLADRFGRALTVGGGLVLAGIGSGMVALQADARSFAAMVPGLIVFGLGLGVGLAPSTTAITDALPTEKQGVASAVNDTVRELGGELGIAVLGSVLNAGYRSSVGAVEAGLAPPLAAVVHDGINTTQVAIQTLPPQVAAPILDGVRGAFVDGWTTSMWGGAGAFLVAAAVTYVLFRREQGPADAVGPGAEPVLEEVGPIS